MLSQMLEMGDGGLREPWPPEFPPTIFLGYTLRLLLFTGINFSGF